MSKIRRMFLGSNSSLGFYSLFEHLFSEELYKYFIIKGGSGTGKSVFMKKIGREAEMLGLDVEYYHCSSDSNSLDGVFIPSLKVALVDGTPPHAIEPRYPGLIDNILDFAQFLDGCQLQNHKDDIIKISHDATKSFKRAYMKLKQASIVLDEIELSFIKPPCNKINDYLIDQIFKDIPIQSDIPPLTRRFFAAAITPEGISTKHKTLIDSDDIVYRLNGTMGLDTSHILTAVAARAHELGLNIEIYYCPLRPASIEMLIIPTLNKIVVGSSPLYEDIDILECNPKEIVNVPIPSQIIDPTLKDEFNQLIDNAIDNLFQAKSKHNALEGIYSEAMDFNGLDKLYKDVLDNIF